MTDFESVHSMLEHEKFPLLYHNPSGEKKPGDVLDISHIFQLAVCSDFQAAMLRNFGDMVFMDAVHGTTKYGYFQLTLLVMDEYGNGCPVAFCMSPVENCEVWVKFIKEAFFKAGRDINQTTFMMDKSTVNIAAMKKLRANYVFCVFHMMQDFDRRVNKDALMNNPKVRKMTKAKILSRTASANFKNFIRENHKFIRTETFLAYYEKEWEPCSSKWAGKRLRLVFMLSRASTSANHVYVLSSVWSKGNSTLRAGYKQSS
jgi:hypothetical protein